MKINSIIASRKSLSVKDSSLLDSKQRPALRKTNAVCYNKKEFQAQPTEVALSSISDEEISKLAFDSINKAFE